MSMDHRHDLVERCIQHVVDAGLPVDAEIQLREETACPGPIMRWTPGAKEAILQMFRGVGDSLEMVNDALEDGAERIGKMTWTAEIEKPYRSVRLVLRNDPPSPQA